MKASVTFSTLAVISAGLTIAVLAVPVLAGIGTFATGMATFGAVFVRD